LTIVSSMKAASIRNLYITRPCSIKNTPKAVMVAQLLSISPEVLSKSLTLKIRITPSNSIESPIRLSECEAKRDAFAKFLYDKLFSWLVIKLNLSINSKISSKSIGLLDIFGFENF
jgi:myosin heavy subunit